MIDRLKLLMGRQIAISKEHGIFAHQPRVNEIVDMGEDEFNNLILPFTITTETVFNGMEGEEELAERFHIFDLFFMELEEGKTVLDAVFGWKKSTDVLSDSLRYFLKVDDINILENRKKIIVNNAYIIDNDEFDKIKQIIQSIVNREDIKVEKAPKNMTPRQKEIWKKLQKGRKRTAEKSALYLQDIVNYTAFGGTTFIPLEQIDKMTYYQLYNAYSSVIGKDSFNISMGYKLSEKFDMKDTIKHWTESMKIGK
ncbi:AMP-binding protein [Bacillus cereus]|uniref:AMP-binding protein n=1 Tax=Bacillus TaxID=1386 RepID=UPI001D159676|nr:AMP-binding protein [Bacillus cereus]MCC3687370.1 AMP-binding protein [Bacillus cereus]